MLSASVLAPECLKITTKSDKPLPPQVAFDQCLSQKEETNSVHSKCADAQRPGEVVRAPELDLQVGGGGCLELKLGPESCKCPHCQEPFLQLHLVIP